MLIRARTALLGAAASSGLAAAVWALAFHVRKVGWADGVVAQGFIGLQSSFTVSLATWLGALFGSVSLAICLVLGVSLAIARGSVSRAIGVAALLVGANLTTQLLKVALAHARYEPVLGVNQVDAASWPSGHATAAMSMALALVIVSPRGWRPVTGTVGGVFAAAAAYSILLRDWHYPSDVLGGFLVALIWALVIIAVLQARGDMQPSSRLARIPARELRIPMTTGALVAGVGLIVGIAGGVRAFSSGEAHVVAAVGTAAIGAAALAVAATFAGLLRR